MVKTKMPLMEIVNLIVDIQISLAANPPSDKMRDDRFKRRSHLLNQLVFAVNRDGEIVTAEDVASLADNKHNALAQRVLNLEMATFTPKTMVAKQKKPKVGKQS